VPAIRDAVNRWRDGDYPGVSDTTRRLLNFWFHTHHRLANGRRFAYHGSQQYAVETLVYLYEVARVRRQKGLLQTFANRQDLMLLQYDDFARYCVKMATGSGKTKVMALVIAWQYFNAVAEARDDFAKTFLVLSPNVIVFERLRTDFEGGRIFHNDPVVPEDLDVDDWLRTKYPGEFSGDKLLIIHTNRSGEVAVKDLDKARAVARDVDSGKSPVNCIVSVVMLREGWDVQGVTVSVGLRPYTAAANILPEQTVGRGLRLMFREGRVPYEERLDVIGNRKFIEFVEQLEREEGLQLDTFEIGKDKVCITTIEAVPGKMDKDIPLPQLSPVLVRKKSLPPSVNARPSRGYSRR
jgi:hypothetical protein